MGYLNNRPFQKGSLSKIDDRENFERLPFCLGLTYAPLVFFYEYLQREVPHDIPFHKNIF